MAGRNQHHFWQAIQRGFGNERKPGYTSVIVYQKDKAPFPVGTRNFGAQRDFFDFEPGIGADSMITSSENELQGLVKYLQGGGCIATEHTESIASLIAHLEARTKFIREQFADIFLDLAGELNRWFSNPRVFSQMMRKYARDNPNEIDQMLAKEIADPVQREEIRRIAVRNFDILGKKVSKLAMVEARQSLQELVRDRLEWAKNSHIKAIMGATDNSSRRDRYRGLSFRLKSGFAGNLICPDTMVAFVTARKLTPFLDRDDSLQAVWVPLASDLLLVGEARRVVDRDAQSILRALATTSHEAFIANADVPDTRRLASRIGKNAQILSASEINSIKRDTLAGLL